MTERAFITGGCGFLGGHLVRHLQAEGVPVFAYDRQTGRDVLHAAQLEQDLKDFQPTVVYHLAALADVRSAFRQPVEQRDQNLLSTAMLLEAMRAADVQQMVFTSSAVVYGDIASGTLSEFDAIGRQTSIYGAVKLGSEALIEAYCAGYGFRADIFRLVSALGEGYRHGNVLDFYRKLKADPTTIHLLGTGHEQKYYVYAGDVIDAIRRAVFANRGGAHRWNLSGEIPITIDGVLDCVCAVLHVDPFRTHEHTSWTGDLPSLVLRTDRIRALGWHPTVTTTEAIYRTVRWFHEANL